MKWDDEREEILESFIDKIYQEHTVKESIISDFIKENFGDLSIDEITNCLKEKYPERFI